MSYVLHIWEKSADRPWPSTIDEAMSMVKLLHGSENPENPKFARLAQRLTKQYPDITSREAEEMPESEFAWSDGPLDGKPGTAVYAIGLARPMLDEVRPFVVQQANALGLSVTDEQAGEVFLANGHVLGIGVRKETSSKTPYDDVPTARDVERAVFEHLTPMMERYGFKPRKKDRSFRQKFKGGWHSFHVYAEESVDHCEFRVVVDSQIDAATEVMRKIFHADKSPAEKERYLLTTMLTMDKWTGETCELLVPPRLRSWNERYRVYRVANRQHIDVAAKHLLVSIETRLFPILEKFNTIEGVDALLNSEPIAEAPLFVIPGWAHRHIIIAYLARNARLEAIYKELLSGITDPGVRSEIVRCFETLRADQDKAGLPGSNPDDG